MVHWSPTEPSRLPKPKQYDVLESHFKHLSMKPRKFIQELHDLPFLSRHELRLARVTIAGKTESIGGNPKDPHTRLFGGQFARARQPLSMGIENVRVGTLRCGRSGADWGIRLRTPRRSAQ